MTFFASVHCLLISNVLGKSKSEFFTKKLKEFGGAGTVFNVKSKITSLSAYSHLVVDPTLSYNQLEKILGGYGSLFIVEFDGDIAH